MGETLGARDYARYALAGIRLFNGVAALFAPAILLRRLGVDPHTDRAATYALRLFGVRTIIIGAELLVLKGEDLDRSLRNGVFIHASDAISAATAGVQRQLAPKPAATATLISSVNVLLALAARGRKAGA